MTDAVEKSVERASFALASVAACPRAVVRAGHVSDLITDLLHFVESIGGDVPTALFDARHNWRAEREDTEALERLAAQRERAAVDDAIIKHWDNGAKTGGQIAQRLGLTKGTVNGVLYRHKKARGLVR